VAIATMVSSVENMASGIRCQVSGIRYYADNVTNLRNLLIPDT
jgi:hypothetical protein